uniref:Uncharacterized protein n=1 Tax=Oryza rufipogon TaxID=4529 RepID=A0A0G2KBR1_ORYRU
MGKLEPCHY